MTLTQLSVYLGIQGEEFNDVRALIAANHVDMAIAHLQAALNSIDVESYEAKTTLEELLK